MDKKKSWIRKYGSSPQRKWNSLKFQPVFLMGSDNGFHFEAPAHKVCIDSFYFGNYNYYIWYFETSDYKSPPV